jgi:AcrR family transcriptional regulator
MKPVALLEVRSSRKSAEERGEALFNKLKPGPGRSTAEVVANQRARLRTAMVEMVAERGFGKVTVRGLSSTAGVSTRTFYDHFPNAEECFTSTYESVMRTALKRFTASGMTTSDWEEAVRSGLRSLTEEIIENPSAGRLALVEAFAAGPAMLREMSFAFRDFEQFVLDTFNAAPDRVAMPLPIVQGIAAGAERVLRARILSDREAELRGSVDELADWALAMHDPAVTLLPVPAVGPSRSGRRIGSHGSGRRSATAEMCAVGNERGRILASVVRLSAQEGYWNLTIPKIRREADVSRRAFDAHFESVSDCYLRGIEALTATASARAQRQAAGTGSWEQRVIRLTKGFCTEVAHSAALARLGFIDVFAPGRDGMECRERLISQGVRVLQRMAPADSQPSALALEASVAAGWRMIQAEVTAGRTKKLPQVAPLIAYVVLAPTVGARRAAEAIGAEQQGGLAPTFKEGERAHAVH